MKLADKYSSIPAEFRDDVRRALSKPASKRTVIERKFIELGEQWLAITKERSELAEIVRAAMRDKELTNREIQEFVRKALGIWGQQAREELAAAGWKYDEQQLRWEHGDRSQIERPALPAAELVESVEYTNRRLADGDVEKGVACGLWLAQALINSGNKNLLNDAIRSLNRQRSRNRRPKPLLGTRALQIAWQEGHRDTASIRNFFNSWGGTFKDDEWGGMSLDVADDFVGWEFIDEGAKAGKDGNRTNKKVKDASLPSMVSRFKKDRGLPR